MTALETANAVLNFAVPLSLAVHWAMTRVERSIEQGTVFLPDGSVLRRKNHAAEAIELIERKRRDEYRRQVADLKRELERKREPAIDWVDLHFLTREAREKKLRTHRVVNAPTTSNDWQKTMLGNAIAATGSLPESWRAEIFDDGEATA